MLPSSASPRGVLALLLATTALPACAAHLELQGGRSYMDAHATNAAFLEATFDPRPLGSSRFDWSPDLSAGWIDGRDVRRYRSASYTTTHSVALLAAGARLHYGAADAWYRPLFFSFQLAANNQTTQALSSHYQFVSTFGWQGEHLSLQLRHVSNGGFNGPNRGETMLLAGLGFDL